MKTKILFDTYLKSPQSIVKTKLDYIEKSGRTFSEGNLNCPFLTVIQISL